jgi:hypothetical protein
LQELLALIPKQEDVSFLYEATMYMVSKRLKKKPEDCKTLIAALEQANTPFSDSQWQKINKCCAKK